MSEHTASAAIETMLINDVSEEELTYEMLGLLEAVDFDYETWCRVVGLDPDSDWTFETFRRVHESYAQLWKDLGTTEFVHIVAPLADKWARLLSRKGRKDN